MYPGDDISQMHKIYTKQRKMYDCLYAFRGKLSSICPKKVISKKHFLKKYKSQKLL